MMNSSELRKKFLEFFQKRGHTIIPSASLIPENDPTVLFTTAGMHPLVPFLLGEEHPAGKRLVDVQKCIRTGDIDDVGDNRHLTFFEMLGNWSLGDYFKEEAIESSWEFLTNKEYLGLDPERLYVSVFMGDEKISVGEDNETIEIWKKQFAKAEIKADICPYNVPVNGNKNYKIFPLPLKDNWWGPAGQTGPCGPCTEMFYDVLPQGGTLQGIFDEEVAKFRIMEIWNDVFMKYNKTAAGGYEKLSQKNVDTGMGLERTTAILNGKTNVFDIDLFTPILKKIEELSRKVYGEDVSTDRAMRIIADHIKAASFILAEKLEPSNVEQGYILRRLIRRAVRHGKRIGIIGIFTSKIAEVIIKMYEDIYPEIFKEKDFIFEQLNKEEEKFEVTLEKGLKEFEKLETVSGKDAFNLYQTYGFPIEITEELAKEKGVKVDAEEFQKELAKHQELSRTASAGMFKGGLADASSETTKLHTAAHLMLAGLRKVLGSSVIQKGSNITAERLRFDFSWKEKMTPEQIKQVEDFVNSAIAKKLPVNMQEMPLQEAKKIKAMGVFESKYGEKVKVYTISDGKEIISIEICGGPHVGNTSELGKFKIIKEEASSSGVRRIKAVLE